MSKKHIPSAEYLRQVISYDPDSGIMKWLVNKGRVKPGDPAFSYLNTRDYLQGGLNGTAYLAHRIAWKWYYGVNPEIIDHIDGDRTNNSIKNLRETTAKGNARNRGLLSSNKFGCPGISLLPSGKYQAVIKDRGKLVYLGRFENLDDAISARRTAEIKFGYSENHGLRLATEA